LIGSSRPEARVALYWAPGPGDPLHSCGSAWLGRDAETGSPVPQPKIPGLDLAELTAAPRLYGLHATLKPPFRPNVSWHELLTAVDRWAAMMAPFALPPLEVTELDGFLALREATACPDLHRAAASCVRDLDGFRRAAPPEELARRRAAGLSARQETYLEQWGYPYVLEEWRFHVTLSRRLSDEEKRLIRPRAEAHFAAAAGRPRLFNEITLFTQASSSAPFLIAERFSLRGHQG